MPADLHAVEPHLAEALHSIKKDAHLFAAPGRISREMQTVYAHMLTGIVTLGAAAGCVGGTALIHLPVVWESYGCKGAVVIVGTKSAFVLREGKAPVVNK